MNIEIETGQLWTDIARDWYEIYRVLAEEEPSWNELSTEKRYAIECACRDIEAKMNGAKYTIDDWQKFVNKRKKKS